MPPDSFASLNESALQELMEEVGERGTRIQSEAVVNSQITGAKGKVKKVIDDEFEWNDGSDKTNVRASW